ncbi:MAG: protoporphyrinogen oxidase [Prevotella sp.]|jgi:oxygen-dependent protoporphyrinogen oxidase|nr:protoporphyrinogen oxidase [Prevotella sp.]MCI2081518.1 protoporphyrinogen oxidase [Prevotella sp.]MCI2103374.1 protoporphyrinogen oxidase [Prevotella sp.]
MTKDIIIIGAGITGLTTAFYAKRRGKDLLVLDRLPYTGGQMRSHPVGDFIFEGGPSTGSISYPEVAELFDDLSGEVEMDIARSSSKCRLIWKGDRFHPMPSGLASAIATPLYSLHDKIRILGEPWRKKGTDPNESVGMMTTRRLGRSFLDYAVDPFINGVYAGDPMQLPTRLALPKLYRLEQNYGSFIRGSIALAKRKKTEREKKATKQIFSAKGGFGQLTAALTRKIGESHIILNVNDVRIDPSSEGTFTVTYQDGNGNPQTVTTRKVVTTCGSYCLPEILPFLPKEQIDRLNNLSYAPVIEIGVGIRNVQGHHYPAFGGLVPSKEKKDVLGILFPSACFDGRAPEEGATLAYFLGGIRHPEMMQKTDAELTEIVLTTLHSLLKYPEKITPDEIRIFRHPHAIPQYQLSTDDRYQAIEEVQQQYPGLIIAGNIRDGIGMADRIRQAVGIAQAL